MKDICIAVRRRKIETVAEAEREFKTGESDEGKVATAKILRSGQRYWNGLL